MQAKAYYTSRESSKGGMNAGTFDTIAWDNTEAALEGMSKMFKICYAKQGSGFCGVGYWMSKWEGNGDSRCPSCRTLNEKANHLNQCPNEARTAVFTDQVTLIEEWMESTYTHPDLQTWLIAYLRSRGKNEIPRPRRTSKHDEVDCDRTG